MLIYRDDASSWQHLYLEAAAAAAAAVAVLSRQLLTTDWLAPGITLTPGLLPLRYKIYFTYRTN